MYTSMHMHSYACTYIYAGVYIAAAAAAHNIQQIQLTGTYTNDRHKIITTLPIKL